jgi:hypothetical protein
VASIVVAYSARMWRNYAGIGRLLPDADEKREAIAGARKNSRPIPARTDNRRGAKRRVTGNRCMTTVIPL